MPEFIPTGVEVEQEEYSRVDIRGLHGDVNISEAVGLVAVIGHQHLTVVRRIDHQLTRVRVRMLRVTAKVTVIDSDIIDGPDVDDGFIDGQVPLAPLRVVVEHDLPVQRIAPRTLGIDLDTLVEPVGLHHGIHHVEVQRLPRLKHAPIERKDDRL